MGMMKKRVKVCNSKSPEKCFEEQFWVDTGALYSFAPEDRLESIGVEPTATRTLVLADGRRETRLLGFCDFQVEGLEGSVPKRMCNVARIAPFPGFCKGLSSVRV